MRYGYSAGTLAQTQAPLRPPGGGTAVAQPPLLSGGASIDLAVPLYQSRVVTVITPANRVSVANPDVADIVVISPTELYVLGKDLGTTNVLLWDHSSHLIGASTSRCSRISTASSANSPSFCPASRLKCGRRSVRSCCRAASAMSRR
jgi:Flp pilus assembly secretin CpaC